MYRPLNFNDERCLIAVEVDYERPDRLLSTKLVSVQLSIAQCTPKEGFTWRRLLAELTRNLDHPLADLGRDEFVEPHSFAALPRAYAQTAPSDAEETRRAYLASAPDW